MKIEAFQLERYFAAHEFSTRHLLCCSDCEAVSIKTLLDLEPGATERFMAMSLGYTESMGHPELRREIAGLYESATPEDVLVFAGAEEAIFIAMNVLLSPGDHVIVHSPCYQSLMAVARAIGCDVTRWEAREASGWTLDPDDLKRALRPDTRLVVVNLPHNPTGHVMGKEAFRRLVALSEEHGFILFSDEVYRLLEYDPDSRLPALCDRDPRGLSLGVMSKAFGLAGLRIGWIATKNRSLLRQMAAYKDYTTICSSGPSEFLSIIGLLHRQTLVERNLAIIRANLALLNDFFKRHPERFSWRPPIAGPIGFPGLIRDEADVFCRHLREQAGVLLLPGSVYGPYPNVRIGFGRKNLPDCLERLEGYLGG